MDGLATPNKRYALVELLEDGGVQGSRVVGILTAAEVVQVHTE
jgi:hypothetical protein